ncbi:hydrolytic protein [Saccharopolyspora dendranthemae]|uniref:Hydrolytic protein n=1 Tax=Saccharopolyspora dendranthemae TaxID=1181886 RepID=A0A561U831_9PSEU|nr:hydrolytic protein [Saccharopolyspora dendranthemae]TWF95526.1 hypothetical protein FHU35_12523 [Saccharopolyspora dendranthemae]
MTTYAEFDGERVEVGPGGEATATFTVRNDTDIVEAYEFEVVGECAAWTAVVPERLPVYPGEQGTVTLILRPPLSADVRAGEVPLAVRVVPAEQSDLVAVPETTVVITPFHRFRGVLTPQRRRAWRSGRFLVSLHNQGNTPVEVPLSATDPAEELSFSFKSERIGLEPGERTDVRLRARAGGLIWFGKPAGKPFHVNTSTGAEPGTGDPLGQEEIDGELVQLPLLPKWLLALLALLLALLLFWFTLALPVLTSAAQEAAEQKAEQLAADGKLAPPQPPAGEPQPEEPAGGPPPPPVNPAETGAQHAATIEVRTRPGGTGASPYVVPEGQDFYVTDLVLANYQGDEGLLTIEFDDRTITTIALETFRNQDYHWVTPIKVPSEARIEATVRCARPGTPPYGPTASRCVQQLNVSGTLAAAPR